MSHSFKKIIPDQEPSEELKKKVMESAARTKLMMEMAELFSTKYIESAAELFRIDPAPGQDAEQADTDDADDPTDP